MLTNVSNVDALGRICVENLFYQVFAVDGERRWDREVARQNLLIQFVRVWVFEGQEPASHGVQDDAAGPDIRGESVVLLAGDHFRGRVARTSARCLQQTALAIGI